MSKKLLKDISIHFLGFYSIYLLLSQWSKYAFSNFEIQMYDGALRVLAFLYVKEGFVPYKDFGFMYPPGYALITGSLFAFQTIEQRSFFLATAVVLLILVGAWIIYRQSDSRQKGILLASLFIVLQCIPFDELAWSEPFSRILLSLVCLFLVIYVRKGGPRKMLFASGCMVFLITILRWNNVLVFFALQVLLAGSFLVTGWWGADTNRVYRRFIIFLLSIGTGLLLGIGAIVTYLLTSSALREGYSFIFYLPTLVISPYRKLTFTDGYFDTIHFFVGISVYLTVVIYMLWSYVLNKKSREVSRLERLLLYVLLLLPLFVVPYVYARADLVHIRYFLFFLGISIILLLSLFPYAKKVLLFLLFIIFVSTSENLVPIYPSLPRHPSRVATDLEQNLKDCKDLAAQVKGEYRSLYVGSLSYASSVLNVASLYLVDPTIKPATAFISYEPGVQTSSEYGSQIIQQLQDARKPMLAFLEVHDQIPENNATATLKSSGVIEAYQRSQKSKLIGTCRAYGSRFIVRLYR